MKRVAFVAFTSYLVAGGAALAADLPSAPPPQAPAIYAPAAPPIYNWSGVYLGINGGYGFASGDTTATLTGNAFIAGSATGSGNISGALAGGTVGANFQSGQVVYGVEGDWDWSGQSRTDTLICGAGCSISETSKIPWLATFRGRVGYAFDRVMIYGTAGGAAMNASDSLNASVGGVSATLLSVSDTAFGWTAGGGVEFGITQNISGKVEYLFVSAKPTGSATVPALLGGGTVTETANISDNLIRAGLNIRFNGF